MCKRWPSRASTTDSQPPSRPCLASHINKMASSPAASRMLLAADLLAFSDAELDRYLEEHRLDGGAMAVEVEDPQNLTESFVERLR